MNAEPASRDAVVRRLHRLFGEWGNERAIQFENRWTTWREIGYLADQLGEVLATTGALSTTTIAIVMRQRSATLAAELSTLSLGRTALLVDSMQGDRALVDDLLAIAPAVIIAHSADWQRNELTESVVRMGSVGLEVDDTLGLTVRVRPSGAVPAGPDLDAAVTVQTSGTTGVPKRLPVRWETFVANGGGPQGRPARSDRGAIILSLPLVTLGGYLSVSRLVFLGRPLAMMERFDVHAWARLVREHRPAVMGAPPAVVGMVLEAGISPDHFVGVTAFTTGSAPVPVDHKQAFEERYGIPVLVGYGATEFLGAVTGWTPELWAAFGSEKAASVGRPHHGVRLRVIDPTTLDMDDVRELPTGAEGLLEVDPPSRATDLPAGWLRTNDRARIDEDGFVWILGRADDVILRGGFKVDLQAVRTTLLEHPAIAAAEVVGLTDERVGEVPGAVVVLTDDAPVPTESELAQWVRDRAAPYAVPVVFVVAEAIPLTSTQKAHRVRLREMLNEARS